MDTKTNVAEILVNQGKNVLASLKDFKRVSHKTDKNRADLYTRLHANQHSFNVYSYMDLEIKQSKEVQAFQENLERFRTYFIGVDTDFETQVDESPVDTYYEEVLLAYNEMVTALGYEQEAVNPKRF